MRKVAITAALAASLVAGLAGTSLAGQGANVAVATHTSPLAGSVYRVESYGAIGSGAVATVACANKEWPSARYVAISGGFQADPGQNLGTVNPLSIAASFPGRMNWNTNEPKPGRLDGWVIEFAAADTEDQAGNVWALCVPRADLGKLRVQVNKG